ncbi:hypothetical protein TNCV_952221 [Trichonephila clavipes]|nr:hypothetical protein TNCV_952221 [Trichonephila clavipes]
MPGRICNHGITLGTSITLTEAYTSKLKAVPPTTDFDIQATQQQDQIEERLTTSVIMRSKQGSDPVQMLMICDDLG